ncbi:class I SAM-dependent methyltransferase [Geomicrobium sp. JCM 19038]|uniref:class I SAM-dependent methyltransferase n=1 Tax=Geomicrobium sp. JCM 19038 TaxID=1460635 RepID=UPI00045F3160|nr:class I SAM-dependent methyltransferase [Geomicrobium sp. JCM 19038]GAK09674.1 adenine-specific methyltransferase [Geomicrobium sp. JCM 19038]
MERQIDTDQLFHVLDEMAETLSNEGHGSYLETLALAGDNLFQGSIMQQPLSDVAFKKMEEQFKKIDQMTMERETVRKAFQLAIIKGMKQAVQPHHAMTPDGIAIFMSYLLKRLLKDQLGVSVYDPAVGTGNMLTAMMNHTEGIERAIGADVDESLIRLAFVMSNLQQYELELYNMDSVKEEGIPTVDVIVSDLPNGIYTNDEVVESFNTKPSEGRMPAEYAIIENSLRALKPGGVMLLLIPNDMFTREHSEAFRTFMRKETITLGMLQLPDTMFKAERHGKSIWMLQKQGQDVVAPQQALFAELPSFTRAEAMTDMMAKINEWFDHIYN